MNALLVRGLSRSQLDTRLRRGDITKIARGIYVWGAPTPLELRGPTRLPTSPFYSLRRTKQNAYRMIDGIRVVNPLLAIERLDAALALELCEALYSTKEGREAIERDRAEFRRLSTHAQKVLTQAALFTDSSAEILVIRALKARGLKVESNYLIGAYRWDIVLPDYKIAIEINGLQLLRPAIW